jgi:hypothetical protein
MAVATEEVIVLCVTTKQVASNNYVAASIEGSSFCACPLEWWRVASMRPLMPRGSSSCA